MKNSPVDYDVIIVGAGLSGIGTAYHLQTQCPQLRFKIIEGRSSIGGTWDLFRYPASVPIRICTLLASHLMRGKTTNLFPMDKLFWITCLKRLKNFN
jgi:monoamine oxidase